MNKKSIWLLIMVIAMEAAVLAEDAKTKTGEGTLTLSKKTYQLAHALAYESATGDEADLTVVLTGQAVSNEKLKKALATEKAGGFAEFPSPYLKLIFKTTGEMKHWSASGGGTTVSGSSDGTGELKLQDGRVAGRGSAPVDPEALIRKGFDIRFDVPLHKTGDEIPVSTSKKYGPAANVQPSVSGVFKGNGKDAHLAYVSAHWTEPFSDKTGILLVFTERDHSKVKKPDNDAMFGKFGDALIISLHEDGDIYGCQVVHSALKNKGFSSSGSIETTGFIYDAGKVEGEVTTNGAVDAFGETWEVKLKFVAPLGEIPKEFQVAEVAETKQAAAKPEKSREDDSGEKPATKPAVAGLNARELALTEDASDIEYKALVEQMNFKSKLPVKSACADLTANLKGQGWVKDGSDLITANSSILKRKRGPASLTIFVKPDEGGSKINLMTEGLSWSGQ